MLTCFGAAAELKPGEHDQEAALLVQSMARALPMGTALLQTVAPDYAVNKTPGLSWEQAVAEASRRFGTNQPGRAVFLAKYLGPKSPTNQLAKLQLRTTGRVVVMSGHYTKELAFTEELKNPSRILLWESRGTLTGLPVITLSNLKVENTVYDSLTFDLEDRLVSVYRKWETNGFTWSIGQNTSGDGGANHHWVWIDLPDQGRETIAFGPDFLLKEREFEPAAGQKFVERYEAGKLRKRVHYQRNANGQTTVAKIEEFP